MVCVYMMKGAVNVLCVLCVFLMVCIDMSLVCCCCVDVLLPFDFYFLFKI